MLLEDFLRDIVGLIYAVKISCRYYEDSLWRFEDLILHISQTKCTSQNHDNNSEIFLQAFYIFVFLCKGRKLYDKVAGLEVVELVETKDDKVLLLQKRFVFLFWLFIFFTSQKESYQIGHFFFLLHYRGLSNSGFDLLKQLGLFISVRWVGKTFKRITLNHIPVVEGAAVYWFDNLFRKIKGYIHEKRCEKLTVAACTLLNCPPLEFTGEKSIDFLFHQDYRAELDTLIRDCESSSIWEEDTYLLNAKELSVPIRIRESKSYQFRELAVLNTDSGTAAGLSDILYYIKNELKLYDDNNFVAITVDYDIFWRIHKFIWANSIWDSLDTFRNKTILVAAPWHFYYKLCKSTWQTFGPLILADLWLVATNRPCPKIPDLKEMLFFYIAIWSIKKHRAEQNEPLFDCSLYGSLLNLLFSELIPLVSTTAFSNMQRFLHPCNFNCIFQYAEKFASM